MNVLLVEDEARVADFLRRGLKSEGIFVECAGDGESALELLKQRVFDVVILDLMLPDISGQDICRKMRARRNYTPVLMLTALDAVDERITGLRLGADDYMTKPFVFDELLARIQALVRRETDFKHGPDDKLLCHGSIRFDTQSLVVTVDGEPIDLTGKERDILRLFLSNIDRVLSRERILNAVWDSQEDPLTNVVDVYVGRLRKKLGEAGKSVQTVRGMGYRFEL